MSLDANKHQITVLLSGFQIYKARYKAFNTVVEIYYPALHFYIFDDENTVYDKNLQALVHPNYKRMMLSNYKSIITNLLSRSLSKQAFQTFQFNSQQFYDDPNFAKLALNYIKNQYSQMTFCNLVNSYQTFIKTTYSNNFDAVQSWMQYRDVFSNHMWPALLLFATLSKDVQTKLLELYGDFTIIDESQFVNKIMSLTKQQELNSSAYVATTNKFSTFRPPSPCPLCKGDHWKRDCPKKNYKRDSKKHAYLSSKVSNLSHTNSDIHDSHIANLAITGSSEPNNTNKSYHNAFLATKPSPCSNSHNWYIDSGCTDHLISDFSSFKDYTPMRGGDIQGISGTVPIKGKGTATKWGYTIKDASYALALPCNLLSVGRMTTTSGKAVIFTDSKVYTITIAPQILDSAHCIGERSNGLHGLLSCSRYLAFFC